MGRIGDMEWDELLTQQEVAALLRVSLTTIRNWARLGTGPQVTRIGAMVRYAESDVHRWLAAHKTDRQQGTGT
jgi:excisionase family DNA binding protein